MALMRWSLLRAAFPDEDLPKLPETEIDGFLLRNTDVKRTRETGAPFYVFEVLGPTGMRVGIASLLSEPSSGAVNDYGHVCVTLDAQHATPQLLATLARPLIQLGYRENKALTAVRIVVPAEHAPSVEACTLLGPRGTPERIAVHDKPFLAFSFAE
jgi:hypothetical protein